jgi:hypothetical protein
VQHLENQHIPQRPRWDLGRPPSMTTDCYLFFSSVNNSGLLFSYPKNKQKNLTEEQKQYVRDMIEAIKAEEE